MNQAFSLSARPSRKANPSYDKRSLISLGYKTLSSQITLLTVRPVLRFVTRAKSATIVASSELSRAFPTSLLRRATTPSLNRDGCFSSSGIGSLKDLILDVLIKNHHCCLKMTVIKDTHFSG